MENTKGVKNIDNIIIYVILLIISIVLFYCINSQWILNNLVNISPSPSPPPSSSIY